MFSTLLLVLAGVTELPWVRQNHSVPLQNFHIYFIDYLNNILKFLGCSRVHCRLHFVDGEFGTIQSQMPNNKTDDLRTRPKSKEH